MRVQLELAHTDFMTVPSTDPWLLDQSVVFGQLVGYGLSATLALLLAAVVWRNPGAGRSARVLFAACAAAWAIGGLVRFALTAAGFAEDSALVTWVQTLAFCAAALWPVSLPLLWNADANFSARERAASTWLIRVAWATALLLIAAFLITAIQAERAIDLRIWTAYNAAAVLTIGAVLVHRHLQSLAERVALTFILLGPWLTILMHNVNAAALASGNRSTLIEVLAKQSIIFTILGGVFYLGRFRAVDRFARLALRIALAWLLAIASAWLILGPLAQFAAGSAAPTAVALALASALVAGTVLGFVLLGRSSDLWVDRRVFGRIDPGAALARFREQLSREDSPAAVSAAAERFVQETLRINAKVVPRTALASEAQTERAARCGRRAGVEAFRIHLGNDEPLALMLAPDERRLLVTAEADLVQQVAHLVGHRLESLEHERDRLERSRREASLVHQLVEAELRALRAQINPHFLFNSLNTIAALVHDDPTVAERMAVRLAKIFRHVLTQTERPFSSLNEEIDFLRAYLDIEQIRFGARLKIDFHVADSVADSQIPSLILQPLVENAIKHGLSPKIGDCRLVISGAREGDHVVLSVEDDGVGARATNAASEVESTGIGLRNVRERLRTLYGERARLLFESHARQGSRAAVYLPLATRS